jgi:hypothetical protein
MSVAYSYINKLSLLSCFYLGIICGHVSALEYTAFHRLLFFFVPYSINIELEIDFCRNAHKNSIFYGKAEFFNMWSRDLLRSGRVTKNVSMADAAVD